MLSARRVYVYLISLISFAAVIFAAISLLRELLIPRPYGGDMDIALQIAILLIATPVYVGHWLWQQRKVEQDEEERGALERRIFLYAILGGAVTVASVNIFDMLQWMVHARGVERWLRDAPAWLAIVYYGIPVIIATGTWFYHARLLRRDQQSYPDTGARGGVHRIYLYLFSAAGLTMVFFAINELLRWLLSTLGNALFDAGTLFVEPEAIVPQIAVGLALWLSFWMSAQKLFRAGGPEEQASVLRKFYLYAAIFIGAAGAVTTAALILSGIFRSLLGIPSHDDIREPIALIVTFVLLWFYHSRVLAEDTLAAERTAQQAEIRRIYLYLLSGVGLVALLVGVIGDISTLLFVIEEGMSDAHREALSYFTAAMIAGLPVWYLAWRSAQLEVTSEGKVGTQARESIVRKIYLYFFLFVSIVSVLSSAVFVLYRLFTWFLSGESLNLVDVAVPLTIAVIQSLVWAYHLNILRTDRRRASQEEVRQLTDVRITLVDYGDSAVMRAVADRLHKAAPDADIPVLRSEHEAPADDLRNSIRQIEQAEIVVAPWSLFVAADAVSGPELAMAIARSTAQKIVLPQDQYDWRWVGIDAADVDETAEETLRIIKAGVADEEIGRRRFGLGAIVLTIFGAIILLLVIVNSFAVLWGSF